MTMAANIIYIAICAALVFIVAVQKSKDHSMGFLGAQQFSAFWEQAKGRTKEARLTKATVLLSVLFFAGAIALLILIKTQAA